MSSAENGTCGNNKRTARMTSLDSRTEWTTEDRTQRNFILTHRKISKIFYQSMLRRYLILDKHRTEFLHVGDQIDHKHTSCDEFEFFVRQLNGTSN